jgi:histidinol-phosphate aminotransferase
MKVRQSVRDIVVYPQQAESGVRMDLNMNIVLPPPLGKILEEMPEDIVSSYPTQHARALRDALAKRFSVSPEQVITSSGSSGLIDLAIKAFVEPGERINLVEPGFPIYDFFAKVDSIDVRHFQLRKKDFWLDWERFGRCTGPCMLASPNNPTGNAFDVDGMLAHVARCEREGYVFVLDEAYGEYARQDIAKRVDEFSNLVVLRTFSKAYAIPGARVGYAIASSEAAEHMAKVRPPFSLSAPSEYIALKMLSKSHYVEKVVNMTEREVAFMSEGLESIGFKVYPSKANFVLARAPKAVDSAALTGYLAKNRIMIKDFSKTPMLENCVRITVGSRTINERFLVVVEEFQETVS